MKKDSIKTLIEPDEIHAYIRNQYLQSDVFKKNYDEGGIVFEIVDRLARYPIAFYESSDQVTETPHFSTWWRFFQHRKYAKPEMHDLYAFHEFTHAALMPYERDQEFTTFLEKMIDNELEASVWSEMGIYHEIPELRSLTLPHPIYVDRFLFPDGADKPANAERLARWQEEKDMMLKEMGLKRRSVMRQQKFSEYDEVEFWIQKFAHQNDAWGAIWKMRFNQVEVAMADFFERCRSGDKKGAMQAHRDWLLSPEITQGTDIPFPQEAKAFSGVYAMNIDEYTRRITLARQVRPELQIIAAAPTHDFTAAATTPGGPAPDGSMG
jgi:hypothetical protein